MSLRTATSLRVSSKEVRTHGEVLYQEDPHSQLRNAWRAEALREALERHYPTGGVSFFVGKSAQVDSFEVHVAVGVPTVLLANTPTLETREREDISINSSLVASALKEILTEARKALRDPVSREDLRPIDRTTAEVVRSAAREFVRSLVEIIPRLDNSAALVVKSTLAASIAILVGRRFFWSSAPQAGKLSARVILDGHPQRGEGQCRIVGFLSLSGNPERNLSTR